MRSPSARLSWLLALLAALGGQRVHAQTEAGATPDKPRIEVVLEGAPEYLQPGLRAALSAERQKASPYLDDLLADHLAVRAEDEALEALQASGFYHAEASAEARPSDTGWTMTLKVTPGPITLIRKVSVELAGPGRQDAVLAARMRHFPLVPHGPLVHNPYEAFKDHWLKLARERGFLDARFTRHEIVVDPEANTADATLVMESGEPYRFGATTFSQDGEMRFDAALIEGYKPWQGGQPYRLPALLDLHRALSDTGYFALVDVNPTPNPITHTVDVAVRLAARPRTLYSFGLGIGTDTGPRGSIEVERRYLNARGDRLFGRLRGSRIDAEAEAEYRRPWLTPLATSWLDAGGNPRTDDLGAAVIHSRERVEDVETETLKLRASANDVRGAWRRQAALTYLVENYRIEGEPEERGQMLLPGLKLGYRPPRDERGGGWKLDLETRGALGGLLSDTSLLQARMDAGWILPMRERDQLLLRGSLAGSMAEDFDKAPVSLRFFAGGDLSVRGYGYKSLGPVNDEGKVVGGRHLVVISAEYDWMFANPWGMALFVDSGNAFDERPEMKTGAGLGLRWRSPVGLAGLDLAHGFDNPDDDFRIHFTLGAEL